LTGKGDSMFRSMIPEARLVFEKFRSERDEYRSLVKAIRKDDAEQFADLAAAAGVSPDELRELAAVRDRAKDREELARKYPAAKREMERFDAEEARLRKVCESATADGHAAALEAWQEAVKKRTYFLTGTFVGAEQAHRYIEEIAKPMGLA
jgi:hypothetical protein